MEMKSADDGWTKARCRTHTRSCASLFKCWGRSAGNIITVAIVLLEILLSRCLHLSSEVRDKINVPWCPAKPQLETFDLGAAANGKRSECAPVHQESSAGLGEAKAEDLQREANMKLVQISKGGGGG